MDLILSPSFPSAHSHDRLSEIYPILFILASWPQGHLREVSFPQLTYPRLSHMPTAPSRIDYHIYVPNGFDSTSPKEPAACR